VVDVVEIYNICARKAIIEAAKRILNSDKVCRSYSDLNFGVTFFGTRISLTAILVYWLLTYALLSFRVQNIIIHPPKNDKYALSAQCARLFESICWYHCCSLEGEIISALKG